MKKLILLLFTTLLVACNTMSFAATPEEALQNLNSKEDGFAITTIMDSVGGNQKGGYYVFEGEIEDRKEWFVAYVVSNDLYWYVKDYIRLGIPTSETETEPAKTDTFIAGWSHKEEDKKSYRFNVNIPDSDYYIWIERRKNKQ